MKAEAKIKAELERRINEHYQDAMSRGQTPTGIVSALIMIELMDVAKWIGIELDGPDGSKLRK